MPCCGCWWNGRQRHRPPEAEVSEEDASGNPRNKCALQPGHSLMDWIRLGNSGKDLTGVGGRVRPVTRAELATHNSKNDAWLAIRGRVYNITHYLPFHPGGPEELMRGAGIDATQLFDKVHAWVNYDSLLAKCLVGPLTADLPTAEELFGPPSTPKSDRLQPSKAQELVRKSMENLANCITPVRKKITSKSDEKNAPSKIMQSLIKSSDLPVTISRRAASTKGDNEAPPPLRFDWIQTSVKLNLSVYTGPLANPAVTARLTEDNLVMEVATGGWLRTLKLCPEGKLLDPLMLKVYAESGKIELTAQKASSGIWASCGTTTCSSACRATSPRTVACRVLASRHLTHDTTLVALSPAAGAVVVPVGHHVRVHFQIEGNDAARSYTPIGDGWSSASDGPGVKLAVKRYTNGVVSKRLTDLVVDDQLQVSGPFGNFELSSLKSVRCLYLFAAGTGVTPMLGLLRFMLGRSNVRCERVHLLFFNKKEEDIMLRSRFDEISKEDSRFKITHILSDAPPTWSGFKGRISNALLHNVLEKDSLKCTDSCVHYACACGPTDFTHTTIELLKQYGMMDTCIHAFLG